jgi:CheY-like chemotaxis protein
MARLLLVEDTEEIRDFLSRRLQRRGHEVALAVDGEDGLRAVREGRPEVVLLDMNLPVLDGWTVARALKDDPATAGVPIIALTAHALAGDRETALAAGCDDYHPKPVDFSRLLGQIEAALARGTAA